MKMRGSGSAKTPIARTDCGINLTRTNNSSCAHHHGHHKHVELCFFSLTTLFCLLVFNEPVCVSAKNAGHSPAELLPPPEDIRVESVSEDTITVSWSPPLFPRQENMVRVFAYVLASAPVGIYSHEDRELMLPPAKNSATISELEPGKQYTIVVSAVYHGNVRSPSRKLIVSTGGQDKNELAVSDEVYPDREPAHCNCSTPGTVACTRRTESFVCSCYKAYEGKWCENCAQDSLRLGKQCLECPCSNLTSTGTCVFGANGDPVCESCLPGHRGHTCQDCSAGFSWKDDHCQVSKCHLSFSQCAEDKSAPGCADCIYPPTAQKSNAAQTIADGTIPLVAVIVTLAVIVLVAAMATCYRYWTRQRTRPRLPLFSVEHRQEKANEMAPFECQYQHLDASASRPGWNNVTSPLTTEVDPDAIHIVKISTVRV